MAGFIGRTKSSEFLIKTLGFAWMVGSLLPSVRADEEWKFDLLRLKNGTTFQGLVLEENGNEIKFRCVRRSSGSPTVVITATFHRNEIQRIEKLDSKNREILETRLKALDPTGRGESTRMENLELEQVPWLLKGDSPGLRYGSAHFELIGNTREDIVRRAAVRLEQLYVAFDRYLPPRHKAGNPTTIYLVRTLDEYQALLKKQGRNIFHPAFYDIEHNQILCASDLQRLGDEWEQVRKKHQQILDQLKETEADLNRLYKGKIPPAIREPIQAKRQEIYNANIKNDGLFREATRHLFQTLYHEAFHAYLANFVYPPQDGEIPRWLNEGLAQIFETAIVEAGELRVGHADPERLSQVKTNCRKGECLALGELLKSGSQNFLVNHASDRQISDRYYLHSWAMAFYLTFDRRLLGTPAMDQYVQSLKRGIDPAGAFQQLVGVPLGQFENDFRHYVLKLRRDGSTAQPHDKK
ncbi:MAG TPA: DUF1570 domain-containing protein [Gemmataceae bacterium]|nr:DUF1570 domain-containing protein [Gemmataceae bacterium]